MSFTKTLTIAMLVIMRRTLRRTLVRWLLPDCGSLGQPPHEDVATGDVRRARRVPLLELAGRLTDECLEPAAERAQAAEPHGDADLGHGEVRGPQQILGALDAALGH